MMSGSQNRSGHGGGGHSSSQPGQGGSRAPDPRGSSTSRPSSTQAAPPSPRASHARITHEGPKITGQKDDLRGISERVSEDVKFPSVIEDLDLRSEPTGKPEKGVCHLSRAHLLLSCMGTDDCLLLQIPSAARTNHQRAGKPMRLSRWHTPP